MKKALTALLIFLSAGFLTGCGGDENETYPVDKKYWTSQDYTVVNKKISVARLTKKELPNLENPKTAAVFSKLIDTNNISVVMNDGQLGIVHRSEFATDMFNEYKEMHDNYSLIDRSDKYQYPVEFAEVLKFGLYLQLYYISAGNEKITKDADDPKAQEVVDLLARNRDVLIRNYDIYLDFINYEDRFNAKALAVYTDGLKEFFPKLINQFAPDGNYEPMLDKIDNMLKKAKDPAMIAELNNIKNLINSRAKV